MGSMRFYVLGAAATVVLLAALYSPSNPKFLIDVRGFPPGTEVIDPNTSKPFKVP
jgi:hypothetical protein